MDPREAAAIEERNNKILDAAKELKIPGRGFNVEAGEVVLSKDDKRPIGWTRNNEHGQPAIRETISYVRVPIEGTKQHQNTDKIAKISQEAFKYDEQGRQKSVVGTDTTEKNSWENVFLYTKDAQGESTTVKGRTTEGEKLGEEWENINSVEKRGDYTKKSRINSGKHFINGELKAYKTVKANYCGPDGKDFLYSSREYDANGNLVPDNNMDWQAEEIPNDFQAW